MIRHLSAVCLVLTLVGLHGETSAQTQSTTAREWDVETDTVATSLPDSVPTTLMARQCLRCNAISLKVTGETQFFLESLPVSLSQLRQNAQGKHFMMIFYQPTTQNVTRIVVHGVNKVKK